MRRGSVLVVVLVVLSIVGALGLALAKTSSRSARTGMWARDHLTARLLAESAAEELFLVLQETANVAGEKTFDALRAARTSASPAPLSWLKPSTLQAELPALERRWNARLTILPPATTISEQYPLSADPQERAGVVRFDVAVQLAGHGKTVVERVRMEHAYKIARTVVPYLPRFPGPTGQPALLIGSADAQTLPNFAIGQSAPPVFLPAVRDSCTRSDGSYRSLLAAVNSRPPDGLARLPPDAAATLPLAFSLLAPAMLSRRAQLVATSPAEVLAFLNARRRAGLPTSALIHAKATAPLAISFQSPPFKGNVTISTEGAIVAGDIKLDDPKRDSVTLIAAGPILVSGRSVQAALVSSGTAQAGVIFDQRAQVLGPVISARFPSRVRLSASDLGQCQVGSNPAFECAGGGGQGRYTAVFSPHPIRLEHLRE